MTAPSVTHGFFSLLGDSAHRRGDIQRKLCASKVGHTGRFQLQQQQALPEKAGGSRRHEAFPATAIQFFADPAARHVGQLF